MVIGGLALMPEKELRGGGVATAAVE